MHPTFQPVLAVAAALVCASAALADEPAPKPEARVDVVVRDRRGRIVRNLESADFSVADGAAKLGVVSAKLVEAGQTGTPRTVSLLFQHLSTGESSEISRDAALSMVAAARGTVDFAVFDIGGKLTLLQTFTRDPNAIRAAIEQATGKNKRRTAGTAEASSKQLAETAARILRTAERGDRGRVPPVLVSLLAIASGQQHDPGRKAAVLFSEGIPIADQADEAFRTIVSAANLAHVSIYTVDASGLATSNEEERARAMMSQATAGPSSWQGSGVPPAGFQGRPNNLPTEAYATTSPTAGTPHPNPAPKVLGELATQTGGFPVSKGARVHDSMRRILEDLSAYYEIGYTPLAGELDGRYHPMAVSATRGGLQVQGRSGFYAVPELPGASVAPYELPLLEILRRGAVSDFPHRVALYHFRGADGSRQLLNASVEVSPKDLEFKEDTSSGMSSAHVTLLGIVRDRDGNIADRFTADAPLQYPPMLLEAKRRRPLFFQARLDLAPGDYTLEVALQDTVAGKYSTEKSPFTVAAGSKDFGISSLAVVRGVTAAEEGAGDEMFALSGKSVIPAIDGTVAGGPHATAVVYCRLYPGANTQDAIGLEFVVLKNGAPVVHSPLQVNARDPKALAPLVSLDVSKLEPGDYDLRLTSRQGTRTAEEHVRLSIVAAPVSAADAESNDESAAGQNESAVNADAPGDLSAAPPAAEQTRLLEQARTSALQYTEKLPNFMCTQVTRRMLDATGKGNWRALDENAQLITFYEGREHYNQLSTRTRPTSEGSVPPSLTSSGEYGSLLRGIFIPESQATFRWSRADNIRGRPVQVLAYSVDAVHSKYQVSYHGGSQRAPVFSAYHGLLFIDADTGAVMRLTHETSVLPVEIPMRQIDLAIDYDYTAIAGQLYLVPVAATLEVHHRKNAVIRNEVSFRAYQRFSVESRIVGFGGGAQ